MFTAIQEADQAQERKSARKELRMKPSHDLRIRAAAAALGLSDSDFITQAALRLAADVERHSHASVLPAEAFAAFQKAVAKPGKSIPGLAAAAQDVGNVLKHGG